jgi:uncharacterized protein
MFESPVNPNEGVLMKTLKKSQTSSCLMLLVVLISVGITLSTRSSDAKLASKPAPQSQTSAKTKSPILDQSKTGLSKVNEVRPALWVTKDADTTIYLFGTVHILPPKVDWFAGETKQAYDKSSEVILEILEPDPSVSQRLVETYAVDPDGPALTAKLTKESKVRYELAMKELGIPVSAFETYEPWFVSVNLGVLPLMKAGFNVADGVEEKLKLAAKRDGKKLGELESFEQQLQFFDRIPEKVSLAMLDDGVREISNVVKEFDDLVASWKKGEADSIGKVLNKSLEKFPEMKKVILTDRNQRWADWIQKRLQKPGTVFIAVGAGHLAGSNSVQSFLDAKNIKVRRTR